MKGRHLLLLLFILSVSTLGVSASGYWIRSSTYLYELPDEKSEKLGVFARGAYVYKLDNAGDDWCEVRTDNKMMGYLKSSFIVKSMNASDQYGPNPEIFYQNDGYSASPHLFVNAASLRARKKPDITSGIAKILLTNSLAHVHFYPYDEEEWVNIIGYTMNEDGRMFVKRKFLGERFALDDVVRTYRDLDKGDVATRKMWIERLMEMTWFENIDDRVSALQVCYDFWKEQKDTRMSSISEFELFRAKAMQNPLTPVQMETFYKPDETFMILNKQEYSMYMPADKLNSLDLPYQKTIPDEEDSCDWADYILTYPSFVLKVYEQEQGAGGAIVSRMDLTVEGNGFVFNGFQINKDTTERDFVSAFGKVITIIHEYPHTYFLNMGEVSRITVVFKDGKAFSYAEDYYC